MPTRALLTGMDEPLARDAGNAVEVRNAVHFLTGTRRDARLEAVTLALAGEMLDLAGLAEGLVDGASMARKALDGGMAAERFARMVAALGGPVDFIERMDSHLPSAPVRLAVTADRPGAVAAIDTRAVGLAVVALGGGRTRPQDAVDHAVGLTELAGLGDRLERGQPLAVVHARSEAAAAEAATRLRAAYRLAEEGAASAPVLARMI